MSRLTTLSAQALRSLFSPDADDTFVTLLTLTSPSLAAPIRLADNYNTVLSSTEEGVLYGVSSRGVDFMFLPMEVTPPSEENGASPRASVVLHDVTQIVLPSLRLLTEPPDVLMEFVLLSDPGIVEMSFMGLKLGPISYNANSITGELGMEDLALEPFPQHTFAPAYFPALF